jgi:hypothetical protein
LGPTANASSVSPERHSKFFNPRKPNNLRRPHRNSAQPIIAGSEAVIRDPGNRCHPERSEGSAFYAPEATLNREENHNDECLSSGHGFSRAETHAKKSGFSR